MSSPVQTDIVGASQQSLRTPVIPRPPARSAAQSWNCWHRRCSAPEQRIAPEPATPLEEEIPPTRAPSVGPAAPPEDIPPSLARLARYRILRRLGAGGMGDVYLASDTDLEREVAAGVLTGPEGSETRVRFLREARAAARLHHPNLCPVYDVGEAEGLPYFTMPHLAGGTLADLLRREGPLDQHRVADLIGKIALALDEAHRLDVIHRDLKPSNIMFDARDEPIVMDFGLACRTDNADVRLTSPGAVLGTPAYMSPEQARGDPVVGPASDVFSLGVVLYEVLTGRQPFASGSVAETLAKILYTQAEPAQAHRPDLSPWPGRGGRQTGNGQKGRRAVCDHEAIRRRPGRSQGATKKANGRRASGRRGDPRPGTPSPGRAGCRSRP